MKKILLLVMFCFFGLTMKAQVPIYIFNNTANSLQIFLSGKGAAVGCGGELTMSRVMAPYSTLTYKTFNYPIATDSWVQGGSSLIYTANNAQMAFGQAVWVQFRFYPMVQGCAGAWLHPGICYGPAVLYYQTPVDSDCSAPYTAKWTNYGSYISVTIDSI